MATILACRMTPNLLRPFRLSEKSMAAYPTKDSTIFVGSLLQEAAFGSQDDSQHRNT
ncbi:hypothetical protein PC128_g27245, partial [Phytophthora cactorum]